MWREVNEIVRINKELSFKKKKNRSLIINLVCLYYQMGFKPKMEAEWFFTISVTLMSES